MSSTNSGGKVLDDVKAGLKGIHSAGEAIRGNVNQSVDHAFKDRQGEAENRAIAAKGEQGVRNADAYVGQHHGAVKTGETTSAGAHSGAPGSLGTTSTSGMNTAGTAPAQEHTGTSQRF